MILAVGIDSIEINRFDHWHNYCQRQLLKVFSQQELAYSFEIPVKRAERLALRFSAKEALFKALCTAFPNHPFNFFRVCKAVKIERLNNIPYLAINWSDIGIVQPSMTPKAIASFTHTKVYATTIVILQNHE